MREIQPVDPFGSVVSAATVEYRATWVDSQGSMPLRGQIWAAVRQDGTALRQDGTALLMSAEHAPPNQWEDSAAAWGPVISETFSQFGAS